MNSFPLRCIVAHTKPELITRTDVAKCYADSREGPKRSEQYSVYTQHALRCVQLVDKHALERSVLAPSYLL